MCFTVSKVLGDGESILGIDYSMSEIQAYIEKNTVTAIHTNIKHIIKIIFFIIFPVLTKAYLKVP